MNKFIKKSLGIAAATALTLAMGATVLVGCGGKGTDYVFEAENAELGGAAQIETGKHEWVSADKINEGAEVTVVGYFGTEGDTITWKINSAADCTATITVKAASAVNGFEGSAIDFTNWTGWKTLEVDTSKNEVFTLSVNGAKASLTGTLPGLEVGMDSFASQEAMWGMFDCGYNNHGTATAKVKLKKGENTIVLAAVSQGVNVDKITINATAELTEAE